MEQSGLGIASLVLGIIGMIFSIILIGIVPCIIALIFSVIVLRKKDKKHGFAIAGLVCSIIGMIVCALIYMPEPTPKTVEMQIGKKEVIGEKYEFTPEKGVWKGVIYPSKASFMDYSYTVKESETPYLFTATLKNIGTEEFRLSVDVQAKIIVNEQYEFDATVLVESKDGEEFEYELKPLQERKCYIYANIPFEVYDVFENCRVEVKFPRQKDFRKNIYVINFEREESGM